MAGTWGRMEGPVNASFSKISYYGSLFPAWGGRNGMSYSLQHPRWGRSVYIAFHLVQTSGVVSRLSVCRHHCTFLGNKILDFIFKSALPIDINFIWLNIFDMNCITKSYLSTDRRDIVSKLNGGIIEKLIRGEDVFSTKRRNEMIDKIGTMSGELNKLQKCESMWSPFYFCKTKQSQRVTIFGPGTLPHNFPSC